MANNPGVEFEDLRQQIADLIALKGDDEQLKETVLTTCARLLTIYNHLQASSNGEPGRVRPTRPPEIAAIADLIRRMQEPQHASPGAEIHYSSILDSESLLVSQLLPDGWIQFANRALMRFFALPSRLPPQSNFLQLLNESDRAVWQQQIAALTPERDTFSLTHTIQSLDGGSRWFQWNCHGTFDPHGRLISVQAVGHDVTGIKRAELEAEQLNRELTALHMATQALLSTLDSEALLGQILDAAISAVPAAEKGTLHLIARDTGQLELRASIGYADPRIQKFSYSESSGYVARAVRERQPLIFHDTRDEIPNPRRELIPEVSAIRSAIVAPLKLNERLLGAVCLESSAPSAFSDTDLRLLVSIAVTATNAIYNAELHAEVQKLAITDALTGLYNRRGLLELGEREIERSFRFNHPLTAIMLDVDHLKDVNDRYGHYAGDQVLRSIAGCCEKQLRKVDIIGRYGGDEFVILLPETQMRLGSMIAERIRRSVSEVRLPSGNGRIQISVSQGIAGLTTDITSLEALIDKADAALYSAKNSGRNQSVPR
ncbi:MAG: diguanylate cyclase [Anaerolineales bacterium]